MTLAHRLHLYVQLMRLDRPIGILLLLWPTLWAIWLASAGLWPTLWAIWLASAGRPSGQILLIFVAGTILMRSAGCVVNDVADRKIDRHVKRTQDRPLTSGKLGTAEALGLATGLVLMAFLLILPLNALTRWLSLPALLLAASYPLTKRFFVLPQAYLGIAFSFGIPMAYAAIQGSIPASAAWLMLANLCWCIAYDTEYAMVDRDDDVHLGIHSSALFFGRYDVLAIMLLYFISLIILTYIGISSYLNPLYFCALLVALAVTLYHYRLIRTRQRAACFKAFLHNNWFGAAVFVGILLG